jgi:hypothetical protein
MESLVLLHAVIIAVFYIFTFANGSQDVAAIAPLTHSNHQLLPDFELEREFIIGRVSEFRHYQLLFVKVNMLKSKGRVDEWLQALARELNSAVYFDLLITSIVHLGVILLATMSHLLAPCFEASALVNFALNIHPEPNVVDGDFLSRTIQMVDNSFLELLER